MWVYTMSVNYVNPSHDQTFDIQDSGLSYFNEEEDSQTDHQSCRRGRWRGVAYPEEDANHCDGNKKISKHPPSSIKLYDETLVSHSSTHERWWFYNLLSFSVPKLLSTEIRQARP
jgi:hypothetical protein